MGGEYQDEGPKSWLSEGCTESLWHKKETNQYPTTSNHPLEVWEKQNQLCPGKKG